jgi:type II secretory pathway pseudopilin PulG
MKNFQFGFTLIEVFVVISIIILLSAISIPSYFNQRKELTLEQSANLLLQSLRKVSEMAVSAREIGPQEAKIIPKGGYGLYLEKMGEDYEILIFADCSDPQDYLYTSGNNVCGISPNKFPEKIQELFLEKGVFIQTLFPSNPLNIVFQPPDPVIYINGQPAVGTDKAEIILSFEGLLKTRKIIVNKTGLIYVEK